MTLNGDKFTIIIPWTLVRKWGLILCLLVLLHSVIETTAFEFSDAFKSSSAANCPEIVYGVFNGQAPKGRNNQTLLSYTKVKGAKGLEACVKSCCDDTSCNAAFIYNESQFTCFKVQCTSDDACLPAVDATDSEKFVDKAFLVLVRPSDHDGWTDLVASTTSLPGGTTESPSSTGIVCEVGLDLEACHENEECVPVSPKSRNGVCTCVEGFTLNEKKQCIQVTTPEPKHITVQIASKEIRLPEDSATLTAFAVPEGHYHYEWKLLSDQVTGNMENSHKQTLSLSQLQQGTYQFKVIVTSEEPAAYGEAIGNLTVLPPKRVNSPPKAIVKPTSQTVNLPTKKAIIDGSSSTDDVEPLTFKWELTNAPLSYQPELPNDPTLTLDNLIEGNYTIKLTVTDTDGVSDAAVAKLQVEPEKDYPPVANAGEDVIIYLPQNEVDLNANQSTDDHGIVSWEWTRGPSPDGKELAADTQNMRTPSPHVSNLEKGLYTFILKVSDAKGQSSSDEVNVYVKPPINQPPKADAGSGLEISLPVTWVLLDGAKSKDDVAITEYKWEQRSGPNEAKIVNGSASVANATGLTKGEYVFALTVTDDLSNTDTAEVKVVVNQDKNQAPVAVAGDDFDATLPAGATIVLNGSASHDDFRIVRWRWTREPTSLAAGKVVANSSEEPVMYLVDAVPGEYVFTLKVWDDQGKSSTDSVSVNVHDNPNKKDIVQAVLNEDISSITQSRIDNIRQEIALLLRTKDSDAKINVKIIDLRPQMDSNYVVIHFLIESEKDDKTKVVSGVKTVDDLQSKLKTDSDILDLTFLELDTLVCQNDCSGHGTCDQATRSCICEPFWLENFVRRQLMDGRSNCEWSIIYVGIFLCVLVIVIVCGFCCLTRRRRGQRGSRSSSSRPASKKKYTKLQQHDDETIEMRSQGCMSVDESWVDPYTSSLMISESDSDDDEILFDSDKHTLLNGGPRNGVLSVATKRNNGTHAQSNPDA